MDTWMIFVVAAVALMIAAPIAWVAIGRIQSERLKRRFATEYALAMTTAGSRSRAEAELASRTNRVERLEIHPLSTGDHERFADRWRSTQALFVDHPADAVSEAETLMEEVMRARGYPVGDFDRRAADRSVDHPRFMENYREARDLAAASQRGTAKIEDLRRATVHYTVLFEDLLQTTARRELEVLL